MNSELDALATSILLKAEQCEASKRLLIGVAGIPGSGKSSLAYPLVDRINELTRKGKGGATQEAAICIGMDGWHYSQETLRGMENPEDLFRRRGAYFTFDGAGFEDFVGKVHACDPDEPIPFPTFSHAGKDPVPRGGTVEQSHRIVVIEGLYCFVDIAPWRKAGLRFTERIWVDVPKHVARDRLIRRHLADGVESTLEAATRRADESDLLNADFVISNIMKPTYVISGFTSVLKDVTNVP